MKIRSSVISLIKSRPDFSISILLSCWFDQFYAPDVSVNFQARAQLTLLEMDRNPNARLLWNSWPWCSVPSLSEGEIPLVWLPDSRGPYQLKAQHQPPPTPTTTTSACITLRLCSAAFHRSLLLLALFLLLQK